MFANRTPDFYREYAQAAAAAKSVKPEEILEPLKSAFNAVYRLVALDIDGTLTSDESADVHPELASYLGGLLGRGVSVVLVTGRKRTATRRAAEAIRKAAGVPNRSLARLSALSSNGLYLLESAPDGELLARETSLAGGLDLAETERLVRDALYVESIKHTVIPDPIPDNVGAGALRVELADPRSAEAACAALRSAEFGAPVEISTGQYATTVTIDITPTNKAKAIAALADRRGIEREMILRIGDRGATGENDFPMLASSAGFSVGSCSSNPQGCWPVLGPDFRPLIGVEATATLLENVLLFAPLNTLPKDSHPAVRDLLDAERELQRQARAAGLAIAERLRQRAQTFATEERLQTPQLDRIQADDLFDPWSGGVRLRDWERPDVPDEAVGLFALSTHDPSLTELPTDSWSMWTDTCLLLRGPKYYAGLVDNTTTFDEFARDHSGFLESAQRTLDVLADTFTVVRWKLLLAILDHARNLSLQTLLATFKADSVTDEAKSAYALAVELADTHAAALLDEDGDWPEAIERTRVLLRRIAAFADECRASCGRIPVYDYRECDWFLENVAALEIALEDLTKVDGWPEDRPPLAVGLANGGAEFPALLAALARRRDRHVDGGLLRLSTYGENKPERTARVREGDAQYVRELLKDRDRFASFGDPSDVERAAVVLCDDNMTTGISLQHARDVMLLRGHRVLGATVVRYPSPNRAAHMNLPGHGFPDPTALGTFVHGLVSPSPYTRLLVPDSDGTGNPYRNRDGAFNKAKARIERLLALPQKAI